MRATAWEFRLRFFILVAIFALGFTAPWDHWLGRFGWGNGNGPNAHLWGTLAAALGKSGVASIGTAFEWILIAAIVMAIAGALLRTWAAAYMGSGVVHDQAMHSGVVLADGPFRYMRNPLYLGLWAHVLALSILMPLSGAVFAVVAVALFQLRLMLAEERFLTEQQGATYEAYRAAVPRILPTLRARVAKGSMQPRWGQAVAGEIYLWGVAISYAVLGWRYNALLLMQCVLVSFGVSLVVRALRKK